MARDYVVVDVDHRLALEATYPAQRADIDAAIHWLRHHASALRIDPGRFAVLGESAGGQLAAIAGLTGTGDTAIRAVTLWYGPSDLSTLRNQDDPFTNPAILLGGPLTERTAFARLASPLHNIHPDAPPFLLVHGTEDETVPFAEAVGFAEALRAQGARCDVLPVEGAGHVFTGALVEVGTLTEASADFLDHVFEPVASRCRRWRYLELPEEIVVTSRRSDRRTQADLPPTRDAASGAVRSQLISALCG